MISKPNLVLFFTLALVLASAFPAHAQHRQQYQQHWNYNYQWQQRSWSVQPFYSPAPQYYAAPPTVYYVPPVYVPPQMTYNCVDSATGYLIHPGPCTPADFGQ